MKKPPFERGLFRIHYRAPAEIHLPKNETPVFSLYQMCRRDVNFLSINFELYLLSSSLSMP